MTEGTPALVHPLVSVMYLSLRLSLLQRLKAPMLLGYREHLPDELKLDCIEGFSLYVFVVWSVT